VKLRLFQWSGSPVVSEQLEIPDIKVEVVRKGEIQKGLITLN
jgi:hypothetical protein